MRSAGGYFMFKLIQALFPESWGWIMAVLFVIGLLAFIIEQSCKEGKAEDPTFRSSKSLFSSDVGEHTYYARDKHPRYTEDKQLHSEGVYPSRKDSFTK
jgi:hypothetical protein